MRFLLTVVAAFAVALIVALGGCAPVDETSAPSTTTIVPPLALTAGPAPTGIPSTLRSPQIGLNFVRYYWTDRPGASLNTTTPYLQPAAIFDDFRSLGTQAYRQFIKADLLWDVVEPQDGKWSFQAADSVLGNREFQPIVTLFALQYASPTPPWVKDSASFQKTLGPEARDYLDKIVQRFGPSVRYWELGNEMDHWRAADPGTQPPRTTQLPAALPRDGFSPKEQGRFLAEAAAFIRQRDADAVIVLPGMAGLDDYNLDTWLRGVIEGGGSEWFDVVNYHFYPEWARFTQLRAKLGNFLQRSSLAGKPVWLTETGSTSSATLTERTNYPNSPESQAADIFRRIIPAYAAGDSLTIWHTYISSEDKPDNDWRLYGIRRDTGEAMPSYYALRLLTSELIPFARAETLSSSARGANTYRIINAEDTSKYVVWGSGDFVVPNGIKARTSVMPSANGQHAWTATVAGETLQLSSTPVLLK